MPHKSTQRAQRLLAADLLHLCVALATLLQLYRQAPRHGRVLRMLVDCYRQLEDWQAILELTDNGFLEREKERKQKRKDERHDTDAADGAPPADEPEAIESEDDGGLDEEGLLEPEASGAPLPAAGTGERGAPLSQKKRKKKRQRRES